MTAKYALAVLLSLAAAPAAAELSNVGDHGFTVIQSITVEADANTAWNTMTGHIDRWWSKDHSWSGDAANLYMKIERGGCFCEKLPGGGEVEHLRIIYHAPGSELRFDGSLGPLQTMAVTGRMIWKIEAGDPGSRITFTYHVSGNPGSGMADIAAAVDAVIGEQLQGLKKLLGS